MQDTIHTIAKNTQRFFSGTLISRFTGMIREISMAIVFGTSPMVAAFWMAFRFAHLLRRLFGEGALHAAFVPHFETLRKQNGALGARFFYDLSLGVVLILLLLTLVIEGTLGGILLFVDLTEEHMAVIRLTMLMLPALIFISMHALNTALLNCERSFFLPSVAPASLNLVWILAIFFVRHQSETKAIEYLAMIIVIAFAIQWLVTLPAVLKFLNQELGEKWRLHRFGGREILQILKPFAFGILGVAATQINSAVDTLFARAADPQGPAFLWYAIRIQQLPLALITVGLTGALLPPIARAIQKGDTSNYLHFLNFALKRSFLLMFPMIAALFCLGLSGINLLYGHGAFTEEAIYSTTFCLWAYGVALLPMTWVLLFASGFYGHKNYRLPTLIALLSIGMNLIFNIVFVYGLHLGSVSIALATALSACINSGCLAFFLKKTYGLDMSGILPILSKTILASLLAALGTLLLGAFVLEDPTLLLLSSKPLPLLSRQLSSQFFTFAMQGSFFILFFFIAAYCLKIKEIFVLLPWSKSKNATKLKLN